MHFYSVCLLSYVLLAQSCSVFSLRFFVPALGRKCIQDEVDKDNLVTGLYEVVHIPGLTMDIEVKDSKGHLFYQKANVEKGKFTFTTESYEAFDVCFISTYSGKKSEPVEVFLDLREGVEAKGVDALAKAEQLKPMEAELKKLELLSNEIVKDFIAMHNRADVMRSTNESTHSRVLYFSIFSMVCLVGLACWQVLYLRHYFKSKKLIE